MNNGRFKKGTVPWNKNKKGVMPIPWNKGTKGICKENSSSFKKGQNSKDKHPMWKGGRTIDKDGYVCIHKPEHPSCNNRKYVFEHRLIMEKHLGRYLIFSEVVHHVNGIRDDNRIENLKLFNSNREHFKECHNEWFNNPNNTPTHRQCNVCKNIFELNEINFYKNKKLKFGFSYTCKRCTIERTKNWRIINKIN